MIRFDRAVRPAGLIRSMKTYSVIIADNFLYLICVGPAMRGVRATNPITNMVITGMANSYEKKIAAGEQELNAQSLQQLSQRKESFGVPLNEVHEVKLKTDLFGFPVMSCRIQDKKITVQFRNNTIEEVQQLVSYLPTT